MAVRTPWQDRYAMALQTSGITSTINFAAASGKGITGASQYGLPLTNRPQISPGPEFLPNDKTLGLSTMRVGIGMERTKTINKPFSNGIEYGEADAWMIANVAWLFFQSGVTQSGIGPYTYTCVPYIDPGAEVWASFCRAMSASAAATDWQVIHGAICTSFTLSAEEAGALSLGYDLMGASFSHAFAPHATADTQVNDLPGKAPLLWQNATITLTDPSLGAAAINIPSFSLTLNNGAVQRFFDEATAQRSVFGKLTGTGTFRLPWAQATLGSNSQLANFISGADVLLRLQWGTTTAGDLDLTVNARYTGGELAEGAEIETDLPFEIASDAADGAASNAVNLKIYTDYALGIT